MIIVKGKVLTKNVPAYSWLWVMKRELECDEIMVVIKQHIFYNHIRIYFSLDFCPVQESYFFRHFLKKLSSPLNCLKGWKMCRKLGVRSYTYLFCHFSPFFFTSSSLFLDERTHTFFLVHVLHISVSFISPSQTIVKIS